MKYVDRLLRIRRRWEDCRQYVGVEESTIKLLRIYLTVTTRYDTIQSMNCSCLEWHHAFLQAAARKINRGNSVGRWSLGTFSLVGTSIGLDYISSCMCGCGACLLNQLEVKGTWQILTPKPNRQGHDPAIKVVGSKRPNSRPNICRLMQHGLSMLATGQHAPKTY